MKLGLVKLGLALALSLPALASTPFAQAPQYHNGTTIDAATGRRVQPPRTSARPKKETIAVGAGGGEVIGYTTGGVVNHYRTLAQMPGASDLLDAGHTLVPVDSLFGDLSGLDRLYVGLVNVGAVLNAAELDAIEDFVLGGGKLVFMGENTNSFLLNNTRVGERFGISYPPAGGDPVIVVADIVSPHPITNGPFGEVEVIDGSINQPTYCGSIADPGPYGTSLVNFASGQSAGVVIEPNALAPGSGAAVFLTDVNVYSQNYFEGDNRIFWNNAFAYCGKVEVDFETADDFRTELANGQLLDGGAPFGNLFVVSGDGPDNYGAAIFDSDPTGPNAFGEDPDLLVNSGNLLILQETPFQSMPGIFETPDDARHGGTLTFDFLQAVELVSVDLIDICPDALPQDATVTLTDQEGRTRTFDVPTGWTGDLVGNGGFATGTLDLGTLADQAGFASIATASEEPSFNACGVVQLTVELSSSGALDNLCFTLAPPNCRNTCLELEPDVPLELFNGGSGTGRSIYLTANSDFSISSVAWYTDMAAGTYQVIIYEGVGEFSSATGPILAQATDMSGGIGRDWNEIAIDFDFEAGNDYIVHWQPLGIIPGWLLNPQPFFNWGNASDDGVDLGLVTILDGREGGGSVIPFNFVAPFFRLLSGSPTCAETPDSSLPETLVVETQVPPGTH